MAQADDLFSSNRFENGSNEVEQEIGNDEVTIKVPFDPNTIKVNSRPFTIGQILDDILENIIDLDTEFQRLPGLWDTKKKSRFIESLLLKLPIPSFYFYEKEENDLEVVDGLQRISTVKEFVLEKKFELIDLEFLKEFNSCKYDELPLTLQRRIRTFPITVYLIEKGTPHQVKYNIFKRINQGGLVLTPQEIRHAINQGRPAELVADLVRWQDVKMPDGGYKQRKNHDDTMTILRATEEGLAFAFATDKRIKSDRMEDRDFATRFLAFYLIDYKSYQPDLDTFLNSGMAKSKSLSNDDILKVKEDFARAMNTAYSIFGNDAFRKRLNKDDDRKPINKALFEVLSVSLAKVSISEASLLIQRKEIFKDKLIKLQNEADGKFWRSITQGTAQKENVEQRFKDIERIVKETLYP
ncbi:DUF262 domain-containing protein [Chitinophaga eiseniae]|uniref:DUF262 domain-containing protein n=1 Tax=Chitinophaga eiseniae TaxID=634771 RepID=A0A847SCZ7_9BACT|nr:DUF262 domain-containing protein [Chitinophaga eiseniae]NLR79671.1 DUF262 domain-containing protein [Chitinophaga eiseniae]